MTVGSQFFNYRNFFSTALMAAAADVDCCFISVEFGACGSSSDSDAFKNSRFGKLLESNKLNIPDPRVLPSDAEGLSMPFVLVCDEAFGLSEHVLRPYPNKKLTCLKRILYIYIYTYIYICILLQIANSTKDSRMHFWNFG